MKALARNELTSGMEEEYIFTQCIQDGWSNKLYIEDVKDKNKQRILRFEKFDKCIRFLELTYQRFHTLFEKCMPEIYSFRSF